MASRREQEIDHILRRAGFGATQEEVDIYARLAFGGTTFALARLLSYKQIDDVVDDNIGKPGYVAITARGEFLPTANITDARQRWLFRMVHTERPLQEKMALFWHNHFATGYTKIAGELTATEATRVLAAKPTEDPGGVKGQLELFRERALGNFRDLLVAVAQDPAMLVWLDGRSNFRRQPQENFARELMELFTMGVGHYVEEDVYAAARVFTGWNLRLVGDPNTTAGYYDFSYIPNNHDPTAKTFTFPIYRDGSATIPARAASGGMQDGIDFLTALATHPATAERLARKMWNFFVSEDLPPDPEYLRGATSVYLGNDTRIKPLVQYTLQSRWFQNPATWHSRYAWPVEFAVRAVKEVGFLGFSVDNMRAPLVAMGQTLFEPPDVNGWELGP